MKNVTRGKITLREAGHRNADGCSRKLTGSGVWLCALSARPRFRKSCFRGCGVPFAEGCWLLRLAQPLVPVWPNTAGSPSISASSNSSFPCPERGEGGGERWLLRVADPSELFSGAEQAPGPRCTGRRWTVKSIMIPLTLSISAPTHLRASQRGPGTPGAARSAAVGAQWAVPQAQQVARPPGKGAGGWRWTDSGNAGEDDRTVSLGGAFWNQTLVYTAAGTEAASCVSRTLAPIFCVTAVSLALGG